MDEEFYKELVQEVIEILNREGPLRYVVDESYLIKGLREFIEMYDERENALEQIGKWV